MLNIRRYLLLLLPLIAGCATTGLPVSPMTNATDVTMGERTKRMGDDLILVTMKNDVHRQLTQGESIQAADRLPPRYASFMALVARKYGLRRVADWPLAALDIRCLVFSTDPANRARPQTGDVSRLSYRLLADAACPRRAAW